MKMRKKYALVVGARPNYVKAFPIFKVMLDAGFDVILINSGQHFSDNMSKIFFDQFSIDEHVHFLHCNPGSQAEQTAQMLIEFENSFSALGIESVIVFGDVNTTLAAAISAKKAGLELIHIEAGLRSFDNSMPEEINRILVDSITDKFFTTCESATQNLLSCGVLPSKIHHVGNTMIDSLVKFKKRIKNANYGSILRLDDRDYGLVTLHRASNTDHADCMRNIADALETLSTSYNLIWPMHPRTQIALKRFGIELSNNVKVLNPLGYIEFMSLLHDAKFVVTDSGGIQEEACYLKVPCFTLRNNTERPITIDVGANILVNEPFDNLSNIISYSLNKKQRIDEVKLWDGYASERILSILKSGI